MKRQSGESLLRKTLVCFGVIVMGIWGVKAFAQQAPAANAAEGGSIQNLLGSRCPRPALPACERGNVHYLGA